MSCHALFQGIFPPQGSNLHLFSPASAGRFFITRATWEAHSIWSNLIFMRQHSWNPLGEEDIVKQTVQDVAVWRGAMLRARWYIYCVSQVILDLIAICWSAYLLNSSTSIHLTPSAETCDCTEYRVLGRRVLSFFFFNAVFREVSKTKSVQKFQRDFPGGPVGKNLPCSSGDEGSVPGWGIEIPHASEQLSPWAPTTEVHAPQLEIPGDAVKIPSAETKTWHSQINTYLNIF